MYCESDIKARIARQFSKAAQHYDKLAKVQWQVASAALQLHTNCDGIVLDLGCGTGKVSAKLAENATQVLGLDIARGMIDQARQCHPMSNCHFYVADAERLPLASDVIDSVFSSMALQWCRPLDRVLTELFRVMKPGATGTLAIMAQGSLSELNQSWKKLDKCAHVNTFETATAMHQAARRAGFTCSVSQRCFTSWHKDILEVLHSIKDIGASVLMDGQGSVLTRKQLRQLDTCYNELHGQRKGLPLNYEIVFLRLHK